MSTNNKNKIPNTTSNPTKKNGVNSVGNLNQVKNNSPINNGSIIPNTPDTPNILNTSSIPSTNIKTNGSTNIKNNTSQLLTNTPLTAASGIADIPQIEDPVISNSFANNTLNKFNTPSNENLGGNELDEGGDYEETMGENYENEVPLNTVLVNQNKRNNQALAMAFNAQAKNAVGYYQQMTGNPTIMLILKVVLAFILLIIVINIIKYFYVKWDMDKSGHPMLIDGTKNAKQAMVISQDPNHTNYVPIKRSVNQNGIEFSYAFWFVISDFTYKNGEWKHMFHKGNSSSYPNRAPGVWIHPTNNIVRIYMNTMQNILEYVDIDNIPIRKWVHMVITVQNRYLNVYVNGFLKIRKELSSLPRQNYGNVWTNLFGGYEGYLSKLQYFDRAITPFDIDGLISNGPGNGACIDTNEIPPYLDDSWWLN
jgi:hypothetical protein